MKEAIVYTIRKESCILPHIQRKKASREKHRAENVRRKSSRRKHKAEPGRTRNLDVYKIAEHIFEKLLTSKHPFDIIQAFEQTFRKDRAKKYE